MVKKLTLGIVVKIQLKNKNIYRQLSENFQTCNLDNIPICIAFILLHTFFTMYVGEAQSKRSRKQKPTKTQTPQNMREKEEKTGTLGAIDDGIFYCSS